MDRTIDLKNSIFTDLAPREIRSLEESAEGCQYSAGEWIVHHGDIWPYFFIVADGHVTALKNPTKGEASFSPRSIPGKCSGDWPFSSLKHPCPPRFRPLRIQNFCAGRARHYCHFL